LVDAVTGSTTVTIPQGGSRNVVIQATSVGAAYNVAPGSINFFSRGVLPGVTVTNPVDWLTRYASGQAGTNEETDDQLRDRDRSKWGTLGTGSPERAYRYWAQTASQSVKKVAVFTNLDIFDSGRVDVFIAGNSGAVGPAVVAAVQNYIAPQQVGGSLIPETAKCVVSSAVQVNVNVTATIFVQAAYNTATFAAQIDDALLTYFQALDIGAFISTDRVAQVMLSPAGLSPGVILDATVTSPLTNVQLAYNEVAALTGTRTLVSV
jgi:phage-related baseplate assembly protein